MAFDRRVLGRVAPRVPDSGRIFALVIALGACGPTVKPPEPPPEPAPVIRGQRLPTYGPAARRVVVGELCPQGAGGRPAVAPLIMRGVSWTDTPAEVTATVERGSVPRFTIFGVDGKPAGAFETLGIVEVGIGQQVATGTYVGALPCTYALPAKSGGVSERAEDPKCGPVTKGCGIAVGEVTGLDDPPEQTKPVTGGACMSGNELAVDIDGDGKIESFPISGALDGIRAPAQEWSASPTATATCTPTFHVYDLKLAPEPRPGKSPEKGLVTLDVLAVVDLDGDNRKELVIAMRFPTVRTIVVYTAAASAQRLELAGEATSFAR